MYENIGLWTPSIVDCVGTHQIPTIIKEDIDVSGLEWIPFNHALSRKSLDGVGIHMFVDDYQLQRLWNTPTRYIEMLKKAACVCAPDFSMYQDTPVALNMYNHYRKHWLSAYWQRCGVHVIPTACWSDADSFDWCFDGDPCGGIVAVSSVGTQRNAESKAAFMAGYEEMMRRLNPEKVLFWGNVPQEATGNIIQQDTYYKQIKERVNRNAS